MGGCGKTNTLYRDKGLNIYLFLIFIKLSQDGVSYLKDIFSLYPASKEDSKKF